MCTLPREERSERCLYGLPGTQQRFLWLLGKGQGAAQQWAGGAVCSAWWCWHRFGHHSWSMRTSLAEPHPYKPPNPISAFLSSLHKAAVEVPRFLKESLRVFFQSPQEALLRDVAQPMLSGCTQWQSAEPGMPPAHLSGLGAVSVCWIINVREVTWLPLQLPVAAQPFLSLSVSSMAEWTSDAPERWQCVTACRVPYLQLQQLCWKALWRFETSGSSSLRKGF